MQFKNYSIYITLLFGVFLGSCKNSTDTGASSGVIIPLKTGNTWFYTETISDSLGNTIASKNDTSTVGLAINRNGETWYFLTFPGNSAFDAETVINKYGGFWVLDQTSDTPILELQYPAAVGSMQVIVADTSQVDNTITIFGIKVVSTSESVTTPKGVFSCYHYQAFAEERSTFTGMVTNRSKGNVDVYAAPNIGIVKQVSPEGGISIDPTPDSQISTVFLTDYSLK